jgi:hypothetical protein
MHPTHMAAAAVAGARNAHISDRVQLCHTPAVPTHLMQCTTIATGSINAHISEHVQLCDAPAVLTYSAACKQRLCCSAYYNLCQHDKKAPINLVKLLLLLLPLLLLVLQAAWCSQLHACAHQCCRV